MKAALLILTLAWGWCGWFRATWLAAKARTAEARAAEAEAWAVAVEEEAQQWMDRVRGGRP